MPSHKVLKSVAHGAAGSFASTMNYRDGDYVMGHLLRAARATGRGRLEYDWLTGRGSPKELLVEPEQEALTSHRADFPSLVARNGSTMEMVKEARLTIDFDLTIARPAAINSTLLESPFSCSTTIVDERGRTYVASVDGWWFPEPQGAG